MQGQKPSPPCVVKMAPCTTGVGVLVGAGEFIYISVTLIGMIFLQLRPSAHTFLEAVYLLN